MKLFNLPAILLFSILPFCANAQVSIYGENITDADLRNLYETVRMKYTVSAEGTLIQNNPGDVKRLSGKVLSIVDDNTILLSIGGEEPVAVIVPSTTNLIDSQKMEILGMKAGVYKYPALSGATKRVQKYEYYTGMSWEQFIDFVNKRQFPELAQLAQIKSDERKRQDALNAEAQASRNAELNRQRAAEAAKAEAARKEFFRLK